MFARLLFLFIVVPAVELYLLIRIGSKIGLLPTIGLILVTGFLGALLTKLQGVRALDNFRRALMEGRLPKDEVLDGVMILLAGAVLLTPGFLTDAAGFALLVPGVRRPVGRWIGRWLKSNVKIVVQTNSATGAGGKRRQSAQPGVIEAEAEVTEVESEKLEDDRK